MAIYDPNSNQHSDGSDSIASPRKKYEIKISGSGSRMQISKALRTIADSIFHPTSVGDGYNTEDIDGATWEDHILITEINEI